MVCLVSYQITNLIRHPLHKGCFDFYCTHRIVKEVDLVPNTNFLCLGCESSITPSNPLFLNIVAIIRITSLNGMFSMLLRKTIEHVVKHVRSFCPSVVRYSPMVLLLGENVFINFLMSEFILNPFPLVNFSSRFKYHPLMVLYER